VKLTDKQEAFCQEYLVDLNATKAAIKAGYSERSASVLAVKLMNKPQVQERIQELQQKRAARTEVSADRVVEELKVIAFSKVTDFLEVREVERSIGLKKKTPIEEDFDDEDDEEEPLTVKYNSVSVFQTSEMNQAAIPAIAAIKEGKNGIELKLHDKTKALELLARHLGMLKDNLNLNADDELKSLFKTVMQRKQ
jgi:phage terminase small subunit